MSASCFNWRLPNPYVRLRHERETPRTNNCQVPAGPVLQWLGQDAPRSDYWCALHSLFCAAVLIYSWLYITRFIRTGCDCCDPRSYSFCSCSKVFERWEARARGETNHHFHRIWRRARCSRRREGAHPYGWPYFYVQWPRWEVEGSDEERGVREAVLFACQAHQPWPHSRRCERSGKSTF